MANKPETVFKVGAVRASIFQNTGMNNGKEITFPKIVLEVRYKDRNGQWQGTNSLSLNDLPKAILALQQAFEHLLSRKQDSNSLETDETQPKSPTPWRETFK